MTLNGFQPDSLLQAGTCLVWSTKGWSKMVSNVLVLPKTHVQRVCRFFFFFKCPWFRMWLFAKFGSDSWEFKCPALQAVDVPLFSTVVLVGTAQFPKVFLPLPPKKRKEKQQTTFGWLHTPDSHGVIHQHFAPNSPASRAWRCARSRATSAREAAAAWGFGPPWGRCPFQGNPSIFPEGDRWLKSSSCFPQRLEALGSTDVLVR